MTVNACGDRSLHDESGEFFLETTNSCVKGLSHGIEIHRGEGGEILDQGLVADLLVQRLNVIMQMDIQHEIGLSRIIG